MNYFLRPNPVVVAKLRYAPRRRRLQAGQAADLYRLAAGDAVPGGDAHQAGHGTVAGAGGLAAGVGAFGGEYLLAHVAAAVALLVVGNADDFALGGIGRELDFVECLFLPRLLLLNPGFEPDLGAVEGNSVALVGRVRG